MLAEVLRRNSTLQALDLNGALPYRRVRLMMSCNCSWSTRMSHGPQEQRVSKAFLQESVGEDLGMRFWNPYVQATASEMRVAFRWRRASRATRPSTPLIWPVRSVVPVVRAVLPSHFATVAQHVDTRLRPASYGKLWRCQCRQPD
eukprot:6195216-Pleurochrysis_carterae.AAC.3